MTTGQEPVVKANLVLSTEHDERLTAIAARLTAQLGVTVSRSAAIRRLIDEAFFSPGCSSERTTTTERNAA